MHSRLLPAVAVILALVASDDMFAARRRAVRALLPGDRLHLAVVTSHGAPAIPMFDFGTVSARRPTRARAAAATATATRTMALRATRASEVKGGTVTLRAWLAHTDPNYTISVDGIELGALPRVIDPAMRLGSTQTYTVTVGVRSEAREGQMSLPIEWEAIEGNQS